MSDNAPVPTSSEAPSDPALHPGGVPGVMLEYIRRTEFKRLMNQVVGSQKRLGFRGLVVLSAVPGEGRTFFTGALALAYAKFLHRRVLILDGTAAGRDGGGLLHSLVGEHLSLGLRAKGAPHYERGRIDLITISNLSQLERESPDFYIGPYLEQVGHHYDLVLVDTAPVEQVSEEDIDPIILAQHVGYAVLLTSRFSLDRAAVAKLCELLQQYETGLIGTVYNHGAR